MVCAKELAVMRILPDPGSLEGVRIFKSTVITICVCCELGVRQNQCQGSQTQTIGEFCSDTEMSCDPERQTRGKITARASGLVLANIQSLDILDNRKKYLTRFPGISRQISSSLL